MNNKKLLPIIFLLLTALLFSLMACNKSDPQSDQESNSSLEATEPGNSSDPGKTEPNTPEGTDKPTDPENPEKPNIPNDPTYDKTPECEEYWSFDPAGKLIKVSYDKGGNIHLIKKYPLISSFTYDEAIIISEPSLWEITCNDPFGIATEKIVFNYINGTLVSTDYYHLSQNHLGERTFQKGYTARIDISADALGRKLITSDIFVDGKKTFISEDFYFDEENNEVLRIGGNYSGNETVYDMSGRLIAVRGNRDGMLVEYGQDGNVSAVRYSVTGSIVKEILFAFNDGKLTSLTYRDEEETNTAALSYDSSGRFVRADIKYTNSERPEMNADGACSVKYDTAGRVLETTLMNVRDGEIVTRYYTYTDEGYFATIRDIVSYTYTEGEREILSFSFTYSNGRPSSITKTVYNSTDTTTFTYDGAGNITFDGKYTYEYYTSGELKKKSTDTNYVIYYENGLPKESMYPGIERSTVVNYFDQTQLNFVFRNTDLYSGTQNETSSLLSFAKKTVVTAADGTVTEYVRTFDDNFNVINTETTVIPPSENPPSEHTHEYTSSQITSPATCEEDGVLTKYCDCGYSVTEPIKAKGHKYYYESITTEPTCTLPGERTFSCSCGDFITEVIEPTDHDYNDFQETSLPTCDQPGLLTIFCSCGAFITSPLEPTGHDFVEERVTREPTCKEPGEITKYCSHGCTVYEAIDPWGHSFHDWSIATEPTCTTEGELIRSCEVCLDIEYCTIPTIEHDYKKVSEGTDENGKATVTLVCTMCDAPAGKTYFGSYLDTNEIFYLTDQPTDFSFEVLSEYGVEAVKEAIVMINVFFLGGSEEDVRENAIEVSVKELESGKYLVSPSQTLDENATYAIINYGHDEYVRFVDMPGNTAVFDTIGDSVNNVEYNKNVIFLKAIAEANGLEYQPSLEYSNEYDMYVLVIPSTYGITDSYVGKVLCIGNCTSFDEALNLPSDEIFIGKIEVVLSENGITGVGLSLPSVLDIYSNIEVSNAKIEQLEDDIVTEAVQQDVLQSVIGSDDFASAIASANIAAKNYATENFSTASTLPRELALENFKITPKVQKIDDTSVKISLYITYTHVIDICEGSIDLGNITFTLSFEISNTLKLDVDTNLSEYFSDKSTPMMFMRCQVTSTSSAVFDMSTSIDMNYSESDEALFIVSIKSQKIHLPSCKHCPKILSENYLPMTLGELASYNSHYEDFECKVCRPFSIDSSTFYINRETWIVHIRSCFHLRNMNADNYLAYNIYPAGMAISNCTTCHPEQYTKTLADHLGNSLKDEDFSQAFESVKKATGDILKAAGESPINEDTDPKILIPIACFEVPIYLEPKFDFALNADFKLHSEVSVTNTSMVALIYRDGDYSIIGDCHKGEPVSTTTIDITGELDIELGVITEVRFGLRYLSKYVYVGLMMDAGVYLDAGGVFSYSLEDDLAYYAASLELGAYAEVRCTYAIIGLIPADSFYILDKTRLPVFNSGDTRVYFRYENTEDTMKIVNVKKLWLDNSYLMCNYYDLKKMEVFRGSLSWSGSPQYKISCVFRDENGKEVDYIIFKDGAVMVLDNAPDNFTVYMTVTVEDKIAYKTFEDYFGKANKNGYAIFLSEKVIEIQYSYTDTTEEMQNALDVYKGTYSFGTDLFGTVLYRNLTIGIHRTEELCENEGMLNAYAIFATYSRLDENGNPVNVYTAEDMRSIIMDMSCEYIMISYASPGNHPFDNGYEFKIVQAYWDNGIYSNSANQIEISSESGSSVYLDLGIPNEDGMFGGVYADDTLTEKVGDFELYRTSKNNEGE